MRAAARQVFIDGFFHGDPHAGNILIDDQYAPLSERIAAAVATVDPDPVRFVINTHYHADHSGGNARLQKLGARDRAQLVVYAYEAGLIRPGWLA